MWFPRFVTVSSGRGRRRNVPLLDGVRNGDTRRDDVDTGPQEALGSGPFLYGMPPLAQIGVVAATDAIG
eukprot:7472874-Heterocapsa_arctica.AAC.1